MRKKQIYDITNAPLIPSKQGCKCPSNGSHKEYECCCDECDHFLYCFPQYAVNSGKNTGLFRR